MLWGFAIPNTQALATRSAGYALSPVRRSGGYVIRRQKMS